MKYVRPDPRARRLRAKKVNERLKLIAMSLNAIGIALVGAAFVFPVIRDDNLAVLLEFDTWGWIGIGLCLHLLAHALFGLLRSEE